MQITEPESETKTAPRGPRASRGATAPAAAFAISLALLASCGKGLSEIPPIIPGPNRDAEADALLRSDPEGPIPKPTIPSTISARDRGFHRDRADRGRTISYTVETLCPELPEAADLFREASDLYTLSDRPVYSHLTLARRLRNGLQNGRDVLHSLGYFEGEAEGTNVAAEGGGPVKITITLIPGPLYRVGGISFLPSAEPVENEESDADAGSDALAGAADDGVADGRTDDQAATGVGDRTGGQSDEAALGRAEMSARASPAPMPELPPLELRGVKPGDPAAAGPILDGVDAVAGGMGRRGRPFAEVTATRYWLDADEKLLYAEVSVFPGDFVRMGPLEIRGDNPTKPGFVENHVTWTRGNPWDQEEVEAFRDALFQTGLFQPARIEAGADSGPDGEREVLLTLNRAPLRTASGSINYDSDFGPGFELSWEHRNLTGWGDSFRADMPVWKDLQQLGLQYTRPFFFSRRQKFLASTVLLSEKAETYDLRSLSASAGIERILSRHLTGKLMANVESGRLDEFVKPEQSYIVWGFPLALDWNWSDSLLDPTRGHRLSVLVAPYSGHYFEDFHIVKTRADGYQYFPLIDDGRLVLALRASVGIIFGAGPSTLPASLRFFSGGGGSVRGFRYRSIGPRNARDRPAGGDFLNEVSSELRWRFSDSMGVVAFVDGGNLYDKFDFSQLGKSILWGGGLGFRYYSPMGPFRVDVAYPISPGPRKEEARFQLYISLGQSF
ncbi:MAG: BamA/TamA family outer membrane protein [Deltaproteobacteria bacterium]|nr:BamA/TamA family outer membrane protein [Deltaproteobacteria bacterium]